MMSVNFHSSFHPMVLNRVVFKSEFNSNLNKLSSLETFSSCLTSLS